MTTLHSKLIPADERDSKRLMIMLHGLGDSVAGYEWLPEALRMPSMNYLLVNAPDPYYGGFAWYDLQNPGLGVKRSRAMLFQLLTDLESRGFAASDIIFSGFSQGCLMSLEIGARYPKKFAGIVGVSGYAYDPDQLIKEFSPVAKEQRFLITHGTQDPLIPFAKVKAQMDILRDAGLNIEWREFVKPHTIAGETEMAVIRKFIQDRYA